MEESVTVLYIIVSILYIIFTYCMYIIGWSDIELFTILKTGTMLSIRYIFESKAQKSANLAARAAHGRQSFHLKKNRDLKNDYSFRKFSNTFLLLLLQRTNVRKKINFCLRSPKWPNLCFKLVKGKINCF